jgi:hypothetical protein
MWFSFVPVDRLVGVKRAAMTAEAADRLQGEYYLRLLIEWCEQIDRRIAKYQRPMSRYQSHGYADEVRCCRRMIRVEQYEQDRLKWMIAAPHRQFLPPGVRPVEQSAFSNVVSALLRRHDGFQPAESARGRRGLRA